MDEKIDLTKLYTNLDESIKRDDHSEILSISSKIISSHPKENEAIKCKLLSLINLNKFTEVLEFLKSTNSSEQHIIEHSYSLYENKQYKDSIDFLNQNKSNNPTKANEIAILLAQNNNKLENYEQSYSFYKQLVNQNGSDIENDTDLLANYLASYALSKADDNESLKKVLKYINSWESLYNFSVINIINNNIGDCIKGMQRRKERFNESEDDDFNKVKNFHMELYLHQNKLLEESKEELMEVDDEKVNKSNEEHVQQLIKEFNMKFKKNVKKTTNGDKDKKKKKKKKIRYPKNYDPKNPGPLPDPERWLPKLQRKKYRNLAKNKLAYQGASADNKTTTTSKFK